MRVDAVEPGVGVGRGRLAGHRRQRREADLLGLEGRGLGVGQTGVAPPPHGHHRALALGHGVDGVGLVERGRARGRHLVLEQHVDVGLGRGDALGRGEGRVALGVEQVAAHAPEVVDPDHQVLAAGLAVVHGHARQIAAGLHLAPDLDHLVPGGGRLQAQLREDIPAVEHQLHVAAQREAQDVAACAVAVARGAQVRIGVARSHVDALVGNARIQGLEHRVQRRTPDVHHAEHVVLVGLGHELGGELLAHARERDVLVLDLDAGQALELGQHGLVRAELRRDHAEHVDRLAGKGLAGLQHRGRLLRTQPCGGSQAGGGRCGLHDLSPVHLSLLQSGGWVGRLPRGR